MKLDQSIIDKIVEKLSKDQQDAVLSEKSYLRIVASAGAGKTETITRRIVYLIAKGEDPKSIVAFTFTEKAAREMKERIYRRVEDILGQEQTKILGDMYIGTIHAFCFKLLQDHFGFGNYDVLDENQEMAFVMRHGWGLGVNRGGNYSNNCETFIRSVNVVYDELLDEADLETSDPDFLRHLHRYKDKQDNHRVLTFGRMVFLTIKHLEKRPEILKDIKHLVVDEYQDINRAQERLIWQIAKNADCYIVGDPRQCIYEWRGSAPQCFDRFAEAFDCKTINITENRRSIEAVVSIGNAIAQHFETDLLKRPMEPIRKEAGPVLCIEHDHVSDEANWVAQQTRNLVDLGICNYSDIAILLRSVSTSGPVIADALKKYNIPFLVGGKIGLFQRDEAQAVGRIFAWCADMFWRINPFTRESLEGRELIESALELWPGTANRNVLEDFKYEIQSGSYKCLTEAYQSLLLLLGFLDLDPSKELDAAVMANLGRFNTLLVDFESAQRRGGSKPNWPQDLKSLAWFMNSYAAGAYEEQPSDDLRGLDTVQLMTVHQAKGLEWPIVFVPALVEQRFPSSRAGTAREWFVPVDLFDQDRYEGGIEAERKLFYVAITRARDALVLSSFRRINTNRTKSRFVDETGLELSKPVTKPVTMRVFKEIGDEEEIVTFAAGDIIEFRRCSYFYRLREIWGYKPPLAELLGYGKSIHHILRTVTEHAIGGRDPAEILDRIIENEFHLPYADPGLAAGMRRSARSALLKYIKQHGEEIRATKQVEARLEFRLSKRATIMGRIDAIVDNDGTLEVRDYKTDDDEHTEQETALQLQLYSLGLNELGQSVDKASLAVISNRSDKVVHFGVGESDLERARELATETVQRIIDRDFAPQCGEFCERCDCRRICKYTL